MKLKMKSLFRNLPRGGLAALTALLAACSASAETYWAKAATSYAAPPKCFTFYSDEACKTVASVTPTAGDGNTYVVLNSMTGKATGSYTSPAGVTWVFGTATGASAGFRTNGGITLNFGNCTIYGMEVKVNSAGTLNWAGTNTLVNGGSSTIRFNGDGLSSDTRSVNLSGKFIADANFSGRIWFVRGSGSDGYHTAHKISGDFTEFKGGIGTYAGSSAKQLNGLELTSASAFGDPTVTKADYLKLANWTRWTIGNDVTQYATKGILIEKSATSAMHAESGASWTLTAPVTNTDGGATLQKTGAGTVTLAGSLSVPNLDVKEGTLVIDSTATFAQATALTIRSGATVVTRQGISIQNVTITKEDGAVLSLDFTVPYADDATEALDYSTLTAEAWAGMDKPLPLKLSTPISHPVNAALRLPMIKLPSSLNATAADFSDTTGKTYDLPVTSFEVEKGDDDCDIVYLNVRPVVYLDTDQTTVGHDVYLLDAKQTDKSGAEYATWSDGSAPHAGADYVIANDTWVRTVNDYTPGAVTFPGDSLTFANGTFVSKAERCVFNRLAVYGGVGFALYGYQGGDSVHVIDGPCHIASSGTLTFNLSTDKSDRHAVDFAGTLTGSGTLAFAGSPNGLNARISGDVSGFAGKIVNGATGTVSAPAFLACADLNALLAPRTVVDNTALKASGEYSGFHATADGTFADAGYALMLGGWDSAISVAEAKTLTVTGKMILGSSRTSKHGAGTLALAGKTLYSGDAQSKPENTLNKTSYYFYLRGGYVKPVAWNDEASYYRTRFVAATSDAGFAFDAAPSDTHIAKYGLCLAYDDAITFDTNIETLPIKVDLPETWALTNGRRKVESRLAVPVLTVTDACAATLAGKLKVVKNYRGAKATITSAAAKDMTGFTTFTATFEPVGLAVIIR